jgi:hypothetical protein
MRIKEISEESQRFYDAFTMFAKLSPFEQELVFCWMFGYGEFGQEKKFELLMKEMKKHITAF